MPWVKTVMVDPVEMREREFRATVSPMVMAPVVVAMLKFPKTVMASLAPTVKEDPEIVTLLPERVLAMVAMLMVVVRPAAAREMGERTPVAVKLPVRRMIPLGILPSDPEVKVRAGWSVIEEAVTLAT